VHNLENIAVKENNIISGLKNRKISAMKKDVYSHIVFRNFLVYVVPAFLHLYETSNEQTMDILNTFSEKGAWNVCAHPGKRENITNRKQVVKEVADLTEKSLIKGIETQHNSHSGETKDFYIHLANELGLVEDGGSDFHGGRSNDREVLGRYFISTDTVTMMRRRLQ